MNAFHEKNLTWFIKLNPGDKVMLYQPKNKPLNELLLVSQLIEKYPINNAFYTKISINTSHDILDYHLIGLIINSHVFLKDLIVDLDFNSKKLKDFKFLNLSENSEISNQIKKSMPFYKKSFGFF